METLEQKAAAYIVELKERAYGPGYWSNEQEGDLGTWDDWERALVEFVRRIIGA